MSDVNIMTIIETLKFIFKDFILFLRYNCSKANNNINRYFLPRNLLLDVWIVRAHKMVVFLYFTL